MNTAHTISHTMKDVAKVVILYGSIAAYEKSGNQCELLVGSKAIDDAVATYLTNCDRATQERFIQTLTAHIRKEDNVEA